MSQGRRGRNERKGPVVEREAHMAIQGQALWAGKCPSHWGKAANQHKALRKMGDTVRKWGCASRGSWASHCLGSNLVGVSLH